MIFWGQVAITEVGANIRGEYKGKRTYLTDLRTQFTFSELRKRGRFIGVKLTQHRKQFCRAAAHRRKFLVAVSISLEQHEGLSLWTL